MSGLKFDMLRKILARFVLIVCGVLVGIIVTEIVLRYFYPVYEYAAESDYQLDASRIWERKANSSYGSRHPDSNRPHTIHHNNLSLRSWHDISEQDLLSTANIGIFGDSFVENVRLPAHHTLTEILEYLLNQLHGRYNVLNFGVDGYGTGQCYISYKEFEYRESLDQVFYVFCVNDLRNIYENDIYHVNDKGKLIKNDVHQPSPMIRFLSKLHITYLILDITAGRTSDYITEHLSAEVDQIARNNHSRRYHSPDADAIEQSFVEGSKNEKLARVVSTFHSLLDRWGSLVEDSGSKFYITLLPRREEYAARELMDNSYNILDLYSCYEEYISDYDFADFRFNMDGHWNERGNLLAALCLFGFLETELQLAPASAVDILASLSAYYEVYPNGWKPDDGWIEDVITSSRPVTHTRSDCK